MSRDCTHYFGKPPHVHKAMLGENLTDVNSAAELLSYCSKAIRQLSFFKVPAHCSSVTLYYLEQPLPLPLPPTPSFLFFSPKGLPLTLEIKMTVQELDTIWTVQERSSLKSVLDGIVCIQQQCWLHWNFTVRTKHFAICDIQTTLPNLKMPPEGISAAFETQTKNLWGIIQ